MQKEDNLAKKVEAALQEIRAQLQMDGGDIELVKVLDGKVEVRLKGACQGCPMASITLQGLIEAQLKEKVADVLEVVAV